jgi:hypothetical protein
MKKISGLEQLDNKAARAVNGGRLHTAAAGSIIVQGATMDPLPFTRKGVTKKHAQYKHDIAAA